MATEMEKIKARYQELKDIWQHLSLGEVSIEKGKMVASIKAFFHAVEKLIEKGEGANEVDLLDANNALRRIAAHLTILVPKKPRTKFKL